MDLLKKMILLELATVHALKILKYVLNHGRLLPIQNTDRNACQFNNKCICSLIHVGLISFPALMDFSFIKPRDVLYLTVVELHLHLILLNASSTKGTSESLCSISLGTIHTPSNPD